MPLSNATYSASYIHPYIDGGWLPCKVPTSTSGAVSGQFSVLPSDTSTCRPGEMNQRPSDNKTLTLSLSHPTNHTKN